MLYFDFQAKTYIIYYKQKIFSLANFFMQLEFISVHHLEQIVSKLKLKRNIPHRKSNILMYAALNKNYINT